MVLINFSPWDSTCQISKEFLIYFKPVRINFQQPVKLVSVLIPFFAAARVSVGKISLRRVKTALAHVENITAYGYRGSNYSFKNSNFFACLLVPKSGNHFVLHSNSPTFSKEVAVLKTYKNGKNWIQTGHAAKSMRKDFLSNYNF